MGGGGGCAGFLQKPIPLRQPFHSVGSRSLRSLSVAGKASKNLRTAATLFDLGSQLPSFAPIKPSDKLFKDLTRIVNCLDKSYHATQIWSRDKTTLLWLVIGRFHLLKTTINHQTKILISLVSTG